MKMPVAYQNVMRSPVLSGLAKAVFMQLISSKVKELTPRMIANALGVSSERVIEALRELDSNGLIRKLGTLPPLSQLAQSIHERMLTATAEDNWTAERLAASMSVTVQDICNALHELESRGIIDTTITTPLENRRRRRANGNNKRRVVHA